MLELADEADSKSVGSDTVRVRPPPPAPIKKEMRPKGCVSFFVLFMGVGPERVCRLEKQYGVLFFRQSGEDGYRNSKNLGRSREGLVVRK